MADTLPPKPELMTRLSNSKSAFFRIIGLFARPTLLENIAGVKKKGGLIVMLARLRPI